MIQCRNALHLTPNGIKCNGIENRRVYQLLCEWIAWCERTNRHQATTTQYSSENMDTFSCPIRCFELQKRLWQPPAAEVAYRCDGTTNPQTLEPFLCTFNLGSPGNKIHRCDRSYCKCGSTESMIAWMLASLFVSWRFEAWGCGVLESHADAFRAEKAPCAHQYHR